MVTAKNITEGPKFIGGIVVQPGQSAEVDVSDADVKANTDAGLFEFGAKAKAKPDAKAE